MEAARVASSFGRPSPIGFCVEGFIQLTTISIYREYKDNTILRRYTQVISPGLRTERA